jgi:hypothetical protein
VTEPTPETSAPTVETSGAAAAPLPGETTASAPAPAVSPGQALPPVESTPRLIGTSFDLLARSSDEMRRASFYIGVVLLGTVGPFALASWALELIAVDKTTLQLQTILAGDAGILLGFLGMIAVAGLLVAAVESRAMAASILGGRSVGRPVTVREAVARSRMSFWKVTVGSLIVAIAVGAAQFVIGAAFEAIIGRQTDVSIVSRTLAAALAGAPFAYLLGGIVLGDVGPFEATRRSFRVFRARKIAAAVVAVFETAATALVLVALLAGLDLVVRVFGALGLGLDSGLVGLVLITVAILAGVFALGTLIYTAYAIAIAPQIVMFVGLTRATFGLDHVRPGGDREPTGATPGQRRFRWLTIGMVLAFASGLVGLAGFVATVTG